MKRALAAVTLAGVATLTACGGGSGPPRIVHGRLSHMYVERQLESQKFTTGHGRTSHLTHVLCNGGRDMPLTGSAAHATHWPYAKYRHLAQLGASRRPVYWCRTVGPGRGVHYARVTVTDPVTGAFTFR